jgi:prophage DNA circulation protein
MAGIFVRFLIMANKIGVVLALDGEQEFTNGMKQAQNASKTLKQDLTALSNEFKGSANSMEYLSQKQQNLTAQQRAYQNTLNAAKAGQKNALENLNKQKEAVDKL